MNRTDQTLVQQMKISDLEIENRKELLDLDREDFTMLTDCKLLIVENIDLIVKTFYDNQTKIDDIVLLIGDADTLLRLSTALRKYILDLFSGYYDSEYVNNRLRIGMVHKRIGVEPKLYLSAVRTLKGILFDLLKKLIKDENQLHKTIQALDKLLYFDITLVFDTYIDSLVGEIETAKQKTESYAKSLEDKVAERTKQLEELSTIDPLTNIYNQRAMYDYLRRELATAKRASVKLSIVYFDIDKFKNINDIEGHIKGDEVLKYIGHVLQTTVREVDIACRYGGDEFTIILPNCNVEHAEEICKKMIKLFSVKYPQYTLSVGIAETGTTKYIDGDQLIKIADEQMYISKQTDGFKISYLKDEEA